MYDATVLGKHAANLYTATLGVAVKDAPSDATAFAFWLSATLMVKFAPKKGSMSIYSTDLYRGGNHSYLGTSIDWSDREGWWHDVWRHKIMRWK